MILIFISKIKFSEKRKSDKIQNMRKFLFLSKKRIDFQNWKEYQKLKNKHFQDNPKCSVRDETYVSYTFKARIFTFHNEFFHGTIRIFNYLFTYTSSFPSAVAPNINKTPLVYGYCILYTKTDLKIINATEHTVFTFSPTMKNFNIC